MKNVPQARIYRSRLANWWVRTMLKLKRWMEAE